MNKDAPTYQVQHAISDWIIDRTDLRGISCYSSRDLYNWKNEGLVLTASADPTSELHPKRVLERPKVIFNQKNGTFIMIMHIDDTHYLDARLGFAFSR